MHITRRLPGIARRCHRRGEARDMHASRRGRQGATPCVDGGHRKSKGPEVPGPCRSAAASAVAYQITTCCSPVRAIGEPALHWNAAAKVGRFDGAPMARNCAGACGSVARRTLAFSGCTWCATRWPVEEALVAGEAVDLGIFLAGGGLLQGVVGGGQAAQVGDVLAQGQVAVHRLAVDLYWSNCLTSLPVRPSKFFLSAGVHQSSMLPVGPKRAPWSS